MIKSSLNSQKNHTYRWYDDKQHCKISCPNRLRLWDIKRTNFKPGSCPDNLLEICYFYISQTKSSLNKIFYKVVYHHIIYMCDFFVNLDDFFIIICICFHENSVCIRYVPIPQWLPFGAVNKVTKWSSNGYKPNQ